MAASIRPIGYRDAPGFRVFREADVKKMADIVRRIGRVEEKKQRGGGASDSAGVVRKSAGFHGQVRLGMR